MKKYLEIFHLSDFWDAVFPYRGEITFFSFCPMYGIWSILGQKNGVKKAPLLIVKGQIPIFMLDYGLRV